MTKLSEILVEEIAIQTDHYVRGSEEAAFGSKRIGCVELPKPLMKSIQDLVEGIHHKKKNFFLLLFSLTTVY